MGQRHHQVGAEFAIDRKVILFSANNGMPMQVDRSVGAFIEKHVSTYPASLAIASGSWQPSYEELNTTANRVAHTILSLGGAAEDRVAVLMAHDSPIIAAIIGVLKS